VEELSKTDDFIDKQKDNWIAFFKSKRDNEDQKQYPILVQFATNWQILEECLQFAKANKTTLAHFNKIISSSSGLISSLVKQLDSLLNALVTNFDDEELPLRKKERQCELVIEKKGDLDAALAIMATEEKIFSEKVDFLQMLTNAAFNPEKSGVSVATQALALSISQPWVLESYNTFIAEYRSNVPARVEFDIDGWQESTGDGSEEKDLLYKQNVYYEKLKDELFANAKFPFNKIVIPILLIVFGLWNTITTLSNSSYSSSYPEALGYFIVSAIGAIWIYNVWKKNEDYKKSIDAQVEDRKQKAGAVLRGLLADTVEYKDEFKQEDSESEQVLNFLNNINSEQFMSISKGAARSILK